MKTVTGVLFLMLFHCLAAYSQPPGIAVSRIPAEGILLNEGWVYREGDKPEWAEPAYDDRSWLNIDPTLDIMELKKQHPAPIFWLRLKINVDSSLRGKTFALSVRQTGSSAIYLNGELLEQFGEISLTTHGYDPWGAPVGLPFSDEGTQYLAVRFAMPDVFLINHFYGRNPLLKLNLIPIRSALDSHQSLIEIDEIGRNMSYFKVGIFLLFAFFHLWLYNYFRAQKR